MVPGRAALVQGHGDPGQGGGKSEQHLDQSCLAGVSSVTDNQAGGGYGDPCAGDHHSQGELA